MTGVEQIRPWFEQAFEAVTGTVLFKEEALIVDEKMALLVGKFYFEPSQGEATGEAGRVALVYRKAADGRWLLAFDMDNRPPDAVADDFVRSDSETYLW